MYIIWAPSNIIDLPIKWDFWDPSHLSLIDLVKYHLSYNISHHHAKAVDPTHTSIDDYGRGPLAASRANFAVSITSPGWSQPNISGGFLDYPSFHGKERAKKASASPCRITVGQYVYALFKSNASVSDLDKSSFVVRSLPETP